MSKIIENIDLDDAKNSSNLSFLDKESTSSYLAILNSLKKENVDDDDIITIENGNVSRLNLNEEVSGLLNLFGVNTAYDTEQEKDKKVKVEINTDKEKENKKEDKKKISESDFNDIKLEYSNSNSIEKTKKLASYNGKANKISQFTFSNGKKLTEVDFKKINENDRDIITPRSVGALYVVPVTEDLQNNNSITYTIDFQNNIEFDSFSRKANYNSYEFMGRIGSLKQYIGTDSQSISISTYYFVEDDSTYNMKKLQSIERKYRALVFPSIDPSSESDDNDYDLNVVKLTKPPIVNIAVNTDKTDKDVVLFKNDDGDYVNYIVTSVSIEKDVEKFRYYIDSINNSSTYDGLLAESYTFNSGTSLSNRESIATDIDGFKVTLTLTEIDYNYFYDTAT